MKRQLIGAGLAVFAVLLFVLITALMATPAEALLQSSEVEPNNSFADADPVLVPGYVTGGVSDTDEVDYFVLNTKVGDKYQATLNKTASTSGTDVTMRIYNGAQGLIGGPSATASWEAYTTTYYVRINAVLPITTALRTAQYRLDIDVLASTPTPTPSRTPTNTPTPSNTPTPTNTPYPTPKVDAYEPNDDFSDPYPIPIATSLTLSDLAGTASFNPVNDVDWYKVWAKNGKWYEVETHGLIGVDTYLEVRDLNNQFVKSDDDSGGGYASSTMWRASYDGYYYIRISNKVGTTGTYDMTITEISEPTSTPTSTPKPTSTLGPGADSAADDCEDNSNFERACVIPLNKGLPFNLVPPFPGIDNDFYKVWVKPGFIYECKTSNLDPGIDPNMIVFNGPSWDNAVGGNDDAQPGDLNSYFAYYATYEGWMYVLIGTGDRTPSDIYNSDYTLECKMTQPSAPTATSTPTKTSSDSGAPTAPPYQSTATPSPTFTSPPPQNLTIRLLTTPAPAVATTPAPRFIPIRLLVYYDGNGDGQLGAGEGITGISAQVYEAATNQLLAQGFTDEQGNLEFTVTAEGPVRISVPFLGFSQLVAEEEATIYLRIPPQAFPGGTP